MRKIKFRGRDKKGIWHYGYLWENPRGDFFIKEPIEEKKHYADFEVIPKTIGQFIGLKDEGGKEIFNGDILHYAGKDVEVIFEDSTASFKVKRGIYVSQISKMMKAQIKVIGNKFENGGLLEG